MADGVKRETFFSSGYFPSAPNTLLQNKNGTQNQPQSHLQKGLEHKGFAKYSDGHFSFTQNDWVLSFDF